MATEVREPDFERDFLAGAARLAGLGSLGFEGQVLARLEQGECEYGDAFIGYPLERFLREIAEEGQDVAGWSTGAAQCAALERLDLETRVAVVLGLQRLAALGAQVEQQVRTLRTLLPD